MTTISGYDLRSARRSLDLLFAEWGNRGIHLWKVDLHEASLVSGQAEYSVSSNVSDVLEAFVSSSLTAADNANTQDISLTKIDRSAYAALPNKLTQGTPSQYYVQRLIAPTISLYATPSASFSGANFQLKFYYMARIQDAGAYTNTADVVYRFYPCMISGLAYYLSVKYSPERTQELRMMYEDGFARALNEDSQGTSSFISPQTFYGDGV